MAPLKRVTHANDFQSYETIIDEYVEKIAEEEQLKATQTRARAFTTFEATLFNPTLKQQAARFQEDYLERKAKKAAEKRHNKGQKFFGKHWQPAENWVKKYPLPSAKILFSNVGPSSPHTETLSLSVQRYCSQQPSTSQVTAIESFVEEIVPNRESEPTLSSSIDTQTTSIATNPTETSIPLPSVSKQTEHTVKLTRTQRRKQKLREKFAANPELTRLSRRDRKAANKVAHELADIFRKHNYNSTTSNQNN